MSGVGALLGTARWSALAMVLCGCLRAELVDCGEGLACAPNSACATFSVEHRRACLPEQAFTPCAGRDPLDECELANTALARCYATDAGLACLPASCGNSLIDPGEACDDGNAQVGDGCSAGCRSDETCGNGVVDPLLEDRAGEACDDGNRVSHDGCASDCTIEAQRWTQVSSDLLGPRAGHRLAYDSTRGRVVLFGGGTNRVFELGEAGWEAMSSPVSPVDRGDATLAYDPIRHTTLLFGGATGSRFGDTWLWSGSTWQLARPPSAPSPRSLASGVYDPASKRVLVFGGDAGSLESGELWAWDGARWSLVEQPGEAPGPLHGAGVALDPRRNVIVLAGGSPPVGTQPSAESGTYEWDGHRWTRAAVRAPGPLQGRGLAFDGVGVIGVSTDGVTWRWDGAAWTVASTSSPDLASAGGAKDNHAIVWDPANQRVVAVANTGKTYVWNRTEWLPLAAAPTIPPLTLYAAAFDQHRRRWVVFGGIDLGQFPRDTWELVGQRWVHRANTGPPGTVGAVMAYDARRRESILLVGGETWSWNGERWLRVAQGGPAAYFGAMAYDVKRGVIVLFGGGGTPASTDETWEWDGAAWMQRTPPVRPPARANHVAVYDPIAERVVIAFGLRGAQALQDVWDWDGTTWTRRNVALGPAARMDTAMTWDARRQTLVVFGGRLPGAFGPLDDQWELSDQWQQQFFEAPTPKRSGHHLLDAPDGNGLLVFGGNTLTSSNEVWRVSYGNATSTNEACTDATLDLDRDGLAGCADPDCWSRCTPSCPPGAPCDPALARCGDHTCDPAEDCRLCPDDCNACAPICGDNHCDPGESCPGDC